ncbi:hypothetical protein [Ideonella sp. YS5]|uniref:hypothetical protein n=1 Tax=Ideonella sp. YS5 TaxID=3453714 RepID=UPI003EEF5524
MFGLFTTQPPPEQPAERFPPVPPWRPVIAQPLDRIVERIRHYSNGTKDFAVFNHGTVAILPDGLSDNQARQHAMQALHGVFHAHPDMNPRPMKDGNILIQYSNDVASVVLSDLVDANWIEIQAKHQDALATHEVLITPLGPNKFDDHGKKALFGRCYMFMDAQDPTVSRIERSAT